VKLKLTIFSIFILFAVDCISQEKNVLLNGVIFSDNAPIADVHIYNISKKQGTISNDFGEFQLKVSVNDTLYVSTLEYEKVYVMVTDKNIKLKQINIELVPLVNELDEVFLRHLTGDLNIDIANKPKDTLPKVGYVYDKKDLYKQLPADSYAKDKRPNAQAITDPIGPVGGGAALPDKRYEEEQRLKREVAQKKEFPEKLKREFGITYFTVNLSIPEEKINNFISYCEYRKIYEKYYSNRVLEVIEILKEESVNYNAIEN
jgi:hypothetical protein